ncbi:MAG TPA: DUF2332 domain-containing protein [Nocardioides sp.]|uniref:DUF2332 domain-containing protein n=1 Tax=Nocardioides sp. TaxID=35761 RepID=UPI002F408472
MSARRQPDLFRQQARACESLGSPMYAELLSRLADDLEAGGPTATVLRGHEDDPGPSGLALRLAGSVHRLVLTGQASELAGLFPTTGGTWSSDGVAAVVDFLDRRADDVRPLLEQAPQTNEVGRSAALVGGLLRLVDRRPLPVRLFEIGSSGGLNLQADRFRFADRSGGAWGDPESPVVLDQAWEGEPLPTHARLSVVERGGCDVHPVDVTTEDGRVTLTSYVWPDMTARHARLAGAIELTRTRPVVVERADAASYLDRLTLTSGTLTVLWHSVMWQYVPRDQQERIAARLAELGATATEDAPLAHLFAEPTRRTPGDEHRFWVCAESWPGHGERAFLGLMAPHGVPVTWE